MVKTMRRKAMETIMHSLNKIFPKRFATEKNQTQKPVPASILTVEVNLSSLTLIFSVV